eukprot:15432277-Alexandrium_andersonii.AAC.1
MGGDVLGRVWNCRIGSMLGALLLVGCRWWTSRCGCCCGVVVDRRGEASRWRRLVVGRGVEASCW